MNTNIQPLRLPFLTGSLLPVLQTASLSYIQGSFNGWSLLPFLLDVGSPPTAANRINDYFDTPAMGRIIG
jgi:1,4-dihydroxy-2-naphthoate octaprenyltransferase